jgi:hypothetical protein
MCTGLLRSCASEELQPPGKKIGHHLLIVERRRDAALRLLFFFLRVVALDGGHANQLLGSPAVDHSILH